MSTDKKQVTTYDHYYTAADVTVNLAYSATGKQVNIDKAVALAFTHNISSVPIYTLGSAVPTFFTKGNSLIQGQMDIAFKSTLYMQTAIDYLVSESSDYRITNQGVTYSEEAQKYKSTAYVGDYSRKSLKLVDMSSLGEQAYAQLISTMAVSGVSHNERSLLNVPGLFDIIITFNNENSNMAGKESTLRIEGVKFTSQSAAFSAQDDTALVDRFAFMARNIY